MFTVVGETWAIVPCGADKVEGVIVPAVELYTSSTFRSAVAAARTIAAEGRILILSAKHGLIALDALVEAYDVRMGDEGSVEADTLAEQAEAHGIEWGDDVYGLLPRAYFDRLDTALRQLDVYAAPVYEGTAGIGEQRSVTRILREAA